MFESVSDILLGVTLQDLILFQIETCQALLIVSLWMPLSGTGPGHLRDSRATISAATTLALNLRLNHSSTNPALIPQASVAWVMDRARLVSHSE